MPAAISPAVHTRWAPPLPIWTDGSSTGVLMDDLEAKIFGRFDDKAVVRFGLPGAVRIGTCGAPAWVC